MKKYSKDDQISLANWAIECAERVLHLFERNYPDDERPRNALKIGREWVRTGVFSMSAIRGASLSAHASAKDVKSDVAACEAAHAAGQAVATAHVPQHAYGGAFYALRALIAEQPEAAEPIVAKELAWQSAQLPAHLREEIMSRIVVEPRLKGLFVTIRKGPGF
jgi:hypothetical protein